MTFDPRELEEALGAVPEPTEEEIYAYGREVGPLELSSRLRRLARTQRLAVGLLDIEEERERSAAREIAMTCEAAAAFLYVLAGTVGDLEEEEER